MLLYKFTSLWHACQPHKWAWAFPTNLVLAAVLAVLLWVGVMPLKRWRYRHIPGPIGLPFVGNLPQLVRQDITRYMAAAEGRYGKVFKVWWGSTPWVVIADEGAARRAMSRLLTRPDISIFALLPPEFEFTNRHGIFRMHGPRWRVARRAFESALMHRAALEMHTSVMNSCIDRLINRIGHLAAGSRGGEVDVAPLMGDLTLDVVGSCMFGVAFNTQGAGRDEAPPDLKAHLTCTGSELVAAMRILFDQGDVAQASRYVPLSIMLPSLRPVIKWLANHFPDEGQRRSIHARRVIHAASRALVRKWRSSSRAVDGKGGAAQAQAPAGPVEDDGAQQPVISDRSFLALLSELRDAGGGTHVELTEPEILAQIFTFLLAGYETTATTLTFALHLLAAHPEAQARAVTEVAAALAPSGGGAAAMAAGTDELARAFPYCSAIIDEALRLYPPAPSTIRMPMEPMELAGVIVPPGTWLHLPVYNFHHSTDVWGEDAQQFIPERHLSPTHQTASKSSSITGKPGPAVLAFGMGARMCPGARFALQEARLALVKLVAAFQFDLPPGTPVELPVRTGITIAPAHPVIVCVRPRAAVAC